MFDKCHNISKMEQRKICILLTFLAIQPLVYSQTVTDRIRLNQLGFYTHAPKIAVVTGGTSTNIFYITSTNLRDTFFTGTLSIEKQSAYSSTKTRIADFSALSKKGTYTVLIPGTGHSYIFCIDNNVHANIAKALLKGYFYQRTTFVPLKITNPKNSFNS